MEGIRKETKRGRFFLFFLLVYISNTAATGCAYIFFYLSQSLSLMGASGSFIMLSLSISRVTMLFALFFFRYYSDALSKHLLSGVLALLSLLAFLGLSGSHGVVPILFFCLLFGFSAFGPIVLSSLLMDSLSPKERLRYYGIFATSYSLSSIVASFLGHQWARALHIPVQGAAVMSTGWWQMVWPFGDFTKNPSAILLVGVFLSGIWILLTKGIRRAQRGIPFYGATKDQRKDVPSLRLYQPFMVWAVLLGILWVCEMDLVAGYASSLGLFEGSGWFFSMFGISAVLGRLGILPILPPRGRIWAFFMGGGLYALSLGALIFSSSFLSEWAIFFFAFSGATLGLAHGVLHTLVNILFIERSPSHPGNATFAYMFLFNAGALVSLSLTLWIDVIGYKGVYWGLLVFLFVVLLYSQRSRSWRSHIRMVEES